MCKTIYRSEFWHPLHNTNAGTIKSPPAETYGRCQHPFRQRKKLKELERANIAFKSKVDIRDKQSYLLNDRIKIISPKNVSAMSQLGNRKPLLNFLFTRVYLHLLVPRPGTSHRNNRKTKEFIFLIISYLHISYFLHFCPILPVFCYSVHF